MRKSPSVLIGIALSRMGFLRAREKAAIAQRVDDVASFSVLSLLDVETIAGRPLKARPWEPKASLERAERDLAFMEARGIRSLCLLDLEYPRALAEIYDPPWMLFYKGTAPTNVGRLTIAIVGTRHPSGLAIVGTKRIARELGENAVTVVSGLAYGIDAAAHEGALLGRGKTVAVLACGIDAVYPLAHKRLAARILDNGGCLLSEYPPDTQALKYRFPERNRIISGLGQAVLVAMAPAKSGALITAEYALDQGRELLVADFGIEGEGGEGAAALARDGAVVVRNATELLAAIGFGIRAVRAESIDGLANDKKEAGFRAGRQLALDLKEEFGLRSFYARDGCEEKSGAEEKEDDPRYRGVAR